MKRNKRPGISLALLSAVILIVSSCKLPSPDKKEKKPQIKHNYIVLLDLSDRLIVQDGQPARDKQIIGELYTLFEKEVRQAMYVKSKDEIKVVIAPQRGSRLNTDEYEDRLYVNMENIKPVFRRPQEEARRKAFLANVDTLYQQAVFSKNPEAYYGADIWKYFYEDLKVDYVSDSLTENFLFILTDGYPIVGTDQVKLHQLKNEYPDLHIVLMEASPRDKDLEWDRVMAIWQDWFQRIGIKEYTLIKRGAISKELEQVKDLLEKADQK